jgi:hypothetical protein
MIVKHQGKANRTERRAFSLLVPEPPTGKATNFTFFQREARYVERIPTLVTSAG